MCVLLPRDGLEDLHFGFYIFTDTKIDQPVKPAKEREKEREKGLLQHRNGEIRDCYILTCLV